MWGAMVQRRRESQSQAIMAWRLSEGWLEQEHLEHGCVYLAE